MCRCMWAGPSNRVDSGKQGEFGGSRIDKKKHHCQLKEKVLKLRNISNKLREKTVRHVT